MRIFIILFGIDILTFFGFFISCVLAVNSRRKLFKDKELMDWMRKNQKIKRTD